MINNLSKEQELAIIPHRDKWLNKIFNYELYNSKTTESIISSMKELYKFCNLKEPLVIILDSPLGCQYMANIIDNIENNVKNNVGDNIENNVKNIIKKYYDFSYYINYSDFGWLSFYEYFLLNTNIIDNYKEKLNLLISFVEHSFMSIQLEEICIVSKYPNKIIRNNNNLLHNINESAISFADGYEQHYFNGIYLTPELFESLCNKTYTFEQWSLETNEEIKSLVLAFYEEKFGGEFIFRFLSTYLKEIHTYIDKKSDKYMKNTTKGMNLGVYSLFKGNINNIDIAYVRCYCPSTDRMFFLGVNPENNNAKDAIASLCQIPTILKEHLISINRQGEMFSFNFDEIGTKMLKEKQLTQEQLNELISLNGEEYFNKLKFEY